MKGIKWLDKNFELAVMAFMLVIMSVLSFVNVIMRYCFHNALSWSDEVSCYCLALSAFLSLPCAIRMGSYIRVDTFVNLLPKSVQRILELICNVGMIVFLILLFRGSMVITQNAAKINQSSPALQIPIAKLYGIIRYIQAIVIMLKKKEGILKARERGVIFDASNGCNNYDIEVCKKAMDQGFMPDIISSDNNTSGYYMQPLHSLPRIMSKYLALGMKLEDVLDAVTMAPARLIHREDLASLEAGTIAALRLTAYTWNLH